MTVLLLVVLVLASAYAARRWATRASVVRRDQVAAFTRARAVTNTWSADPQSTPAPLKAFLARQRRSSEDEEPGQP